jgi:hypothetical protein
MSTNTLAGAFANAVTATPKPVTVARPPQTVTLEAQVIPMHQRESGRKPWMDDDLLLIALQHSLRPGDQIMARRTMLRPAPWEKRAA